MNKAKAAIHQLIEIVHMSFAPCCWTREIIFSRPRGGGTPARYARYGDRHSHTGVHWGTSTTPWSYHESFLTFSICWMLMASAGNLWFWCVPINIHFRFITFPNQVNFNGLNYDLKFRQIQFFQTIHFDL